MVLVSSSSQNLIGNLISIFSYQFNEEFTRLFFDDFSLFSFKFSRKTGKIKHIYYDKVLQASYRPQLGTFSLTIEAGNRVFPNLKYPRFQVMVQNDISSFIKDGKSVFAKHIIDIDPNLKIGQEVFIVNEDHEFLAIGKLEIPSSYISFFQTGSAVSVRKGINSLKSKK